MEKYHIALDSAGKKISLADHMIYVTFPLVKEKRLLIKILGEINNSIKSIIEAILQYEYAVKRITISKIEEENFRIFKECSNRYKIFPEDIQKIIEIFNLMDRHKKSAMEFIKKEKFVIMSDNLNTNSITLDKLKEYLVLIKHMFKETEETIKEKR